MSNWLSRVVVAAILVPIVLGVVYLGGWYLFAFVAIACAIALHEYWLLGRALSRSRRRATSAQRSRCSGRNSTVSAGCSAAR